MIRQYIRKDIVQTHQKKQGTSTMGGCMILFATTLSFILFVPHFYKDNQILAILFTFLFFGSIGLIDDLFKITFKNSKGLSVKLRLLFEIIGCLVVTYLLYKFGYQKIHLPLTKIFIPLGSFLLLYYIFVLVGSANAVNFTDGLDGLATGLMIISLLPFLLIALKQKESSIAYFIIALMGSLFAFLKYNFNPAKLFMGDVGSLAIGASYAMIAIVLKSEILILVSGFLFVIEILSVILQVAYFKISHGKRIFLMAPLHHHFEKKGLPEWKVVMIFWMIGFVSSIIASMIGVIE